MCLNPRYSTMLHALWREGRLSRAELHKLTGIRPTTVGQDASALVQMGIVRECQPHSEGMGRPSTPLEIDPSGRHVVGISIHPAGVELVVMNLLGRPMGEAVSREVGHPSQTVRAACSLLEGRLNRRTLAIGISTTGSVDVDEQFLRLQGREDVSLKPLKAIVGDVPVLINNDMVALAAQWVLQQQAVPAGNVALIHFGSAGVGAAFLVQGDARRRFINPAAELGHTRLLVETDRCYCGHTGCLTQICSDAYLKRLDPEAPSLKRCAALYPRCPAAMERLIEHLSIGLANAPTMVHLDRMVLVSELLEHAPFADRMVESIRRQLPLDLARRTEIEVWREPGGHRAETGGWVALAGVYITGWSTLTRKQAAKGSPVLPFA